MKRPVYVFMAIAAFLLFTAQQCSEKEQVSNRAALEKLFEEYAFGQIEACTYKGQTVYHAGINAFDAGSQVYDENGKSIGTCNYATGMVDAPCELLEDCETVYRCNNHISGKPAVDKYGLDKKTEEEK